MNKQYIETKELEQKHDYHHLHIKIRTITNVKRISDSGNSIMDRAEESIYYEKREIKDRWVEYIDKLFDDTRDSGILPAIRNNIEWDPPILMCESE